MGDALSTCSELDMPAVTSPRISEPWDEARAPRNVALPKLADPADATSSV